MTLTSNFVATNNFIESSTPLFKLYNWEIRAVARKEYAFIFTNSIIVHQCDTQHTQSNNWQLQPLVILNEGALGKTCGYCEEPCPDEIQGLWRLQNMEKL